MKQFKQAITVLFSVCLCAVLPYTASAQLAIVDPTAKGSITIQSLSVNDTSEYQTPGTGQEADVDDVTPLPNISYTITLVEDTATTPEDADAVEGDGAFRRTETTDSNGQVRFDGLEQGLYLVQQVENAAVQAQISDFLVSVPMTAPSGTGWLYDIHVYPKYQLIDVPEIDAFISQNTIKSDSANLLDTVHWMIASQIPADIAGSRQYQIRGTLHEYLDFNENSLSISTNTAEGATISLTAPEDYTASADNGALTVTLTPHGQTILETAISKDFSPVLHTQFSTELNIPPENLIAALGTPISIDAALHYTGMAGITNTIALTGPKPYVYTGGVTITQYEGSSDHTLGGAAFKIYRSLEDASSGINAVQTPGGSTDWIATTTGEGTASFLGLAYGGAGIPNDTDNGSEYYLVQTQAPAGYNLLRAPVPVTVDAARHLNPVELRSNNGFLLPATGGMGTFWFTVAGLCLIGLAAYFYYRSRKRNKDAPHDL